MHDASSEQPAPSEGHSERKQSSPGVSSLRQKLGTAALALLTLGVGAIRAEEAADDVGLLFGSEMDMLARQSLQELQVEADRAQEQLARDTNAREKARERRDEAQQLKNARERRLETMARSHDEIIAEANRDRLESIAQDINVLEQKVAEAEEAQNRAESEIASLDRSIAIGNEASQQLQRKVGTARTAPVLAIAERAPNVVRYLAPYSSLVVNRRNLILLLKPGVNQLDFGESLRPIGMQVVETWSAGDHQAILVERNREAGELRLTELMELEESLRYLTSTANVQQILADPLLFGADPYSESDTCIKKVLTAQSVSPQEPCIKAAIRLRLPISLALLRRPKVKSQLVSVNVGILDVGFTTPGHLVSNNDEHGDVVRRVLDFALGEWQTPRPLNIAWFPAAAPGKTVPTSSGALNGVLLPKSLRLLETLDRSGVRVTNVSLGSNEFLLDEKPQKEDLLGVRVVGYQQLIDGYAELSDSMFVASAAGNDASCWKGYKAIWSSPLNASQLHAVQIVAQLKPGFVDVDDGSNFIDPSALLMTPSGTTKRTCIKAGPVAQVQTSYATPYVSAVATIVAAILPQADGATIRRILRETTIDRVPDALAAALCALNRRGINPWQALADTNNDGTLGPDDRVALIPSGAGFGAIYGGADLNGNGAVGGPDQRKLFGIDLSDSDLMDIAGGLRTAPALPAVCQ